MYRTILFTALLAPSLLAAQALLHNDGAAIKVENGALVHVQGGITNAAGGTIDNDGSIQLEGDWTNNVANGLSSTSNFGTVTFLGSVQQNIGGTQSTDFHNLTIDNTAGVLLGLDASAGGTNGVGALDLSTGFLDLNSNTITITNPTFAGITSSVPSTYIISESASPNYGSVDWEIGSSASAFPYVIPFGTALAGSDNLTFSYTITSPGTGATGAISVKTYPSNNDNLPLPTGIPSFLNATSYDLSLSATDRFWVVDLNGFTSNPSGDITIAYQDTENDPGNTITEGNLVPFQWNTANGYWEVNGSGSTVDPGLNNITGINAGNTSSFWTFLDDAVLLPISLIDFQVAAMDNSYIATWWMVDREEDVDHYTVERSLDGISFRDIGQVDAIGNPNYGFDDVQVEANQTYYYRLKWTDFDGSIGYSPVRTARITAGDVWDIGHFYPSPTTATSHIDIHAPKDANFDVLVFNQLGQQVAAFTGESVDKGTNTLSFDLSKMAHGSYVFQFQSNDWRAVRPVVKLR